MLLPDDRQHACKHFLIRERRKMRSIAADPLGEVAQFLAVLLRDWSRELEPQTAQRPPLARTPHAEHVLQKLRHVQHRHGVRRVGVAARTISSRSTSMSSRLRAETQHMERIV